MYLVWVHRNVIHSLHDRNRQGSSSAAWRDDARFHISDRDRLGGSRARPHTPVSARVVNRKSNRQIAGAGVEQTLS